MKKSALTLYLHALWTKNLVKKFKVLRADADRLAADLAQLAAVETKELKARDEEAWRQARVRARDTARMTREKTEEIDEYVHENPWAVVLVSSLAFLALGHILSRTTTHRNDR